MDRNDGLCLAGNGLFYTICVKIQRILNAVNEYWFGLKVGHNLGSCRKGHRRNKDFVSFLYACSFESQMEGSRTGIHRNGMFSPDHRSKFPLEVPHLRSSRQPTGPKHINDFGHFFFA